MNVQIVRYSNHASPRYDDLSAAHVTKKSDSKPKADPKGRQTNKAKNVASSGMKTNYFYIYFEG